MTLRSTTPVLGRPLDRVHCEAASELESSLQLRGSVNRIGAPAY